MPVAVAGDRYAPHLHDPGRAPAWTTARCKGITRIPFSKERKTSTALIPPVLIVTRALGHGMDPKVLDDPVITAVARRVHKTPAQVALAWAVQRGSAFLTASTTPRHIRESFEISALPDDAMQEMRDRITTNIRFNTVVGTGVPGFIPRVN